MAADPEAWGFAMAGPDVAKMPCSGEKGFGGFLLLFFGAEEWLWGLR